MATDNLKQTGAILRKNKRDSDFVTRRVEANYPLIERLRDSFDTSTIYVMEFRTQRAGNVVEMTIEFKESFEHVC